MLSKYSSIVGIHTVCAFLKVSFLCVGILVTTGLGNEVLDSLIGV
jgi:hypothetical protein